MAGLFTKSLAWFRQHPGGAILVLGLMAAGGFGAYHAGRYFVVSRGLAAAREAMGRRDFEAAQVHLDRCLALRPDDGEVHFLAARLARRRNDYARAERYLQTCHQLEWPPKDLALERAMMRAQQGDLREVGGPLLSLALEGHPDAVLMLEALAAGYFKNYQLGEARHCLDLWLERAPGDEQALLWRGETSERLGREAEAADYYRQAVARHPDGTEQRLRLARLLLQAKQYGEAAEHFAFVHRKHQTDPAAAVGLARCQEALDNADEARRVLDALLKSRPDEPEALVVRGRLALAAENLDDAEKWLREAVRLAPFEREVVYQFILCLGRRGHEAEAEKWRERLLQIEEDLTAIQQAHRQVLRAPREPGPRCEAGRILLRNGQTEGGLRYLTSALKLDPGHRLTHQTLADYYERVGEKELAARHRQAAAAR